MGRVDISRRRVIQGLGDFDGDGKSDILMKHSTGLLIVWLMNGATVLSATYVTTVDPGYAVVGSGDLDGDAKADIVWRGAAGDVWVWLMNGTTPTAMTYLTTVGDLGYRIAHIEAPDPRCAARSLRGRGRPVTRGRASTTCS